MTEAPVLTSAAMPIVRIAVLADRRLTEIAVPAELPLREILPAVQRLVAPDSGDSADSAEPGTGVTTRLSLAPVGGAPFSLDASLDTVGVVDGDLLALRPVPVGPAAPGIVEDIADAAVIFSASRRKPWGGNHIRRGALAAGTGLILAATGLATAHGALTGEPAGLFAAAAIALLTVLAALLCRTRSAEAALTLSIAALVPLAAAGTLAVPGLFGPAHVVLGAAAVTAWSLICLILPPGGRGERGIAFFTAAVVAGVGVLAAAAVKTFWELPFVSLGCGLITASLLLTVAAPQLSALWARLPLPVIPAPGDPTPSALPQSVLEDLPRRVRVTDAHQTGFVAGAVLLAVLGSVAIAFAPEGLSGWAWYVVAGIGLASVLRARVWDSAWCKAWLLAQPHLTAVVLLACYAATGRFAAAFGAVLVLAALVAVWAVVALSPTVASPDSYSLPVRRLVGFLASGVDATLIPVMAYLVGIFAWVLSR
ncbi:type VII secretion integral membrane protein EccD [Mycolicibacter senuensis]|uniref:Type VII secretion integral membrane protein EccD n=1 Tax=Mycolicibacter senuensis TaxID=386913 RepID=A0A7I9XPC4_9MYCO|nr:type VII secretion integral membrane protein EccD [Mycolicibacter senuensis]ORW69714.1 type VII secretion integral membrane protein EccD [Mycolicibacter senuensis]GFG71813.1 type VII secretion integral membrane protein EccD [Mycolicibacter senuensis]